MRRTKWTQATIVQHIQELHRRGVDLSARRARSEHSALFSSARSPSHFGSWRKAVEAAGIEYESVRRGGHSWPRQAILEEIKAAAARGDNLLSTEFKRRNARLVHAASAKRHLGSWKKALHAAGVDYATLREEHYWSKSKIIRAIGDLAALSEPLNWSNIDRLAPGLYRAARRKETFGSWQNALRAAGVDKAARVERHVWTRETIVREIRRLHQEGASLVRSQVDPGLLAAAISSNHFGSWERAVAGAGLDQQAILPRGTGRQLERARAGQRQHSRSAKAGEKDAST